MNPNLDTVKLNFEFLPIPQEERDEYSPKLHHALNLQFFLNEKELKTYTDNYMIIEALEDYRWGDNNEYSEFYVISCSCGEPGCNGIHNGILIDVSDDTVTWTIPKDDGYEKFADVFSKDTYVFDKKEYLKTFQILPQVLEFISKQGWKTEDIAFVTHTSLEQILQYAEERDQKMKEVFLK